MRCKLMTQQVVYMFNAQNQIRQLMNERGWTIYRLAQESGLSQTTISNIFKRNNQPSLPTVNAICDACGITLAQSLRRMIQQIHLTPRVNQIIVLRLSRRISARRLAAFIKTIVQYITAQPYCAAHSRGYPSYVGQSLRFFTNQRRRIHEQGNYAGKHTICGMQCIPPWDERVGGQSAKHRGFRSYHKWPSERCS